MAVVNQIEKNKAFLHNWLRDRQKGRTDLRWLCNNVLGYKDVKDAHMPMINSVQKFPGREEVADPETLNIVYSKPKTELWALEGPRNHLLLWPRGHLKTTVNTIAHSIQWILNYEDVRILISTAVASQAEDMLSEIKAHFQYNQIFRFLYPEYCPAEQAAPRFGNNQRFSVPNRKTHSKEPTVMVCSLGGVMSSRHFEVLKHSDVEDNENVRTDGGLRDLNNHFHLCEPLVERSEIWPHHGWTTVEGTIYHFSGYHNRLLETQMQHKEHEREWFITHASAEIDPKEKTTLWPAKFPWDELKRIERRDRRTYANQYLLKPIADQDSIARPRDIVTSPHSQQKQLLPQLRLYATVDLASMEEKADGAYSVVTVGGFDNDGRLRVLRIHRGHYMPDEMIDIMYDIYKEYPQLIQFKVEKNQHAEVLLPIMRKIMPKRGWLPITSIPPDNHTSKTNRILGLQPWFANHDIIFSDNIECLTELMQEATKFPAYKYRDILDTIVMLTKLVKDAPAQMAPHLRADRMQANWERESRKKFLGFDPYTKIPLWSGDELFDPLEVGNSMAGAL